VRWPPGRLRPALEAVGERGLWPAYVAFVALANFASPLLAYLALAAYSALALSRGVSARAPSPPGLAYALAALAAAEAPLRLLGQGAGCSAGRPVLVGVAAVVEEAFFRGVMLPRLGLLPQAFAFSLAHLDLSDPVALVESALLAPHYLLLGVAFGLVAERDGYLASAAAHCCYNALSAAYALPLDARTVAAVVALDSAALALLLLPRAWDTLKRGAGRGSRG